MAAAANPPQRCNFQGLMREILEIGLFSLYAVNVLTIVQCCTGMLLRKSITITALGEEQRGEW
jgi:hypothetical protein